MFGLQKHLNAFVDNIKKGVDAEAAVTVNKDKVSRFRRHSHSTPLSTTSSADGDDRRKRRIVVRYHRVSLMVRQVQNTVGPLPF
jgi:hypothetical protein